MTKARDIADFKFENIVDTGTAGTKVASGTTAQRGSTTGQWRYNTTTGFFEGKNTDGSFSTLEPTPSIISVDTTEIDSAGGGNITIRVTGTNFLSGGTIKFIGNDASEITASTSTFVNTSNYDAVIAKSSFVNAKEPYDVKYIASSGLTAIGDNLINVDNSPTWSTASGNLATVYEGQTANVSATATDADGDTVSYSVQSGSLPAGTSLNTSTGAITGTLSAVSNDTTSNFNLRATANSKTADRSFNIIVKDDGIMSSAEFWIDVNDSRSWSGSGSTLTNLGTNASGNTTNLSLNGASVATAGGITYIDYNHGSANPPSSTLGNFSGNLQNYTIAFFQKMNTASDGVTFHYGGFTTNLAIGANPHGQAGQSNTGGINHYNYGNDRDFLAGATLSNWNFVVLRKVSGTKQLFVNNTEFSASSGSNNNTNLPSNSTMYLGRQNYDNVSTDYSMVACWATNISDSDITYIWNRFKGDVGL